MSARANSHPRFATRSITRNARSSATSSSRTRRSNSMQTTTCISPGSTCSERRSPALADGAAPCTAIQHLPIGRHERVCEALQLKQPADLCVLLDDREQLVEVLCHPPLNGQRRNAPRRDRSRPCIEACRILAPTRRPRPASAHRTRVQQHILVLGRPARPGRASCKRCVPKDSVCAPQPATERMSDSTGTSRRHSSQP